MSDSDSDFNDVEHQKLLKKISLIDSGKELPEDVQSTIKKVNLSQLVNSIKSTKNLNDVKKRLQVDVPTPKEKKAKKAKKGKKKAARTLDTPLHRQEKERIESAVAYKEIKQDLRVWDNVVADNRTAEQLVFPLDREPIKIRTGAEKSEQFTPRTELEKQMSEVLSGSKNNLTNKEVYTEAEREIIKTMSLKEAKAKCSELQRLRALMSYRQAKMKREARIKSKKFHRIKKREQRKKLIKEFEDLVTRDPEAAKEKLAELELDRIEERGSLRHSTKGKWKQQLVKYASRSEGLKQFLDDHMNLGKELRSKHDIGSDSDESDDDEGVAAKKTVGEILREAAEAAANEDKNILSASENPYLRDQLAKIREAKKAKSNVKTVTNAQFEKVKKGEKKVLFEEDADWTVVGKEDDDKDSEVEDEEEADEEEAEAAADDADDEEEEEVEDEEESDEGEDEEEDEEESKTSKKASRRDIDEIFDDIDRTVISSVKKSVRFAEDDEEESDRKKKAKKRPATTEPDEKKSKKNKADVQDEISLNPKDFLSIQNNALIDVSKDVMDTVEEMGEELQQDALAAAFEDDDVIGDFEEERDEVHGVEKPKDIDLTLLGWGSWTGPGIEKKTPKKRFVLKAKEKKRKDRANVGLIIRENVDSAVEKLQPNEIPFPFTTIDDYEASLKTPIGRDWNPVQVSRELTKQAVRTESGRIIRPLNKEATLSKREVVEVSDGSDAE